MARADEVGKEDAKQRKKSSQERRRRRKKGDDGEETKCEAQIKHQIIDRILMMVNCSQSTSQTIPNDPRQMQSIVGLSPAAGCGVDPARAPNEGTEVPIPTGIVTKSQSWGGCAEVVCKGVS